MFDYFKKNIDIKIRYGPNVEFKPKYSTVGSTGLDIFAQDNICIPSMNKQLIENIPHGGIHCFTQYTCHIRTGLFLSFPKGYDLQIRSRSSLASNYGLIIPNGVGTIDSDYRGELIVPLLNLGIEKVSICLGQKIAQLILVPSPRIRLIEVENLDDTVRGEGGFGSTDK